MNRPTIALLIALLLLAAGHSATAAGDASAPSAAPSAAASEGSGSPAQSGDLGGVMQKYVEALGGRSTLSKVRTTVSVYVYHVLGRTLVVTTTTKTPFYLLQVTRAEGGQAAITVGFDGKTAWQQGPDGVVHTLTGRDREELVSDAAGGNDSEIFPDRWPTVVALKPPETHGGKTYQVLSVTAKDGITHDVLLEPETYRPTIDRIIAPDHETISVVNDFGKGPLGELQPNSITTTRSDGFPQTTATLRSVQDNVTVNDFIFAPPAGKGETV